LWVGVKGYANVVIAGFPRNKFKFSVFLMMIGVEHFTVGLSLTKKTPNTYIYKRQLDLG
jgi:hypothetical protein